MKALSAAPAGASRQRRHHARLVLAHRARATAWCFGFTDHDRSLDLRRHDLEPEFGFAASEIRAGTDLAVDAQDAEGVLTSDRITETDILDGRWDNAAVEVWRVNWSATSASAC